MCVQTISTHTEVKQYNLNKDKNNVSHHTNLIITRVTPQWSRPLNVTPSGAVGLGHLRINSLRSIRFDVTWRETCPGIPIATIHGNKAMFMARSTCTYVLHGRLHQQDVGRYLSAAVVLCFGYYLHQKVGSSK